jgi:mannose-6-phosphate isomerase-like protein (cupin superfamily)
LDTSQGGNVTEYFGSIERSTLNNSFFRQVLFTGRHEQLVLMCLQKGEDIGEEVHEDTDQFFRIEEGEAKFVVNGKEHIARNGDAVIVPAGARHNVINNSDEKPVRLYTIYSPPQHPDGTIEQTKEDAEKNKAAV